ncbi:NAD(P)-dependent alcohol dehydrogenase [Rhodoferax sp.]|uniref:NAD(P)-dependent alcohol dehydrogenase n=1 Tax=Rhodoferax sp. TaxID=50421 RepID=UPI0026391B49|nr:NAD(P)-dependent alcohol dehydrogenase [Rhodoferax sp.]MDD2927027.1 NAD(P)-dependent alcohol dehydrogenase [Rhodoferax sp.]
MFTDRPIPTPKANELLVRVRASTVSSADWRIRSLTLPRGFGPLARPALGLFAPRQPVLGTELSGEVMDVGSAVTRFKPGDLVFAFTGSGLGCHQEYRCVAEDSAVALKPHNLSHAQAAALSFGGATMLDFYRRAGLKAGDRVLVNGASGTVGTAAVQLARHRGAHVTGVCRRQHAGLVRTLGAERVLDRATEDFVCTEAPFDVIVDTVGSAPHARCAPVLSPGGSLLLVLSSLPQMLLAPWHGWRSDHRVIAGPVKERPEYIHNLRELALAGAFTPVIDSTWSFRQIRQAHARVDQGSKCGSVVVLLGDADDPA